MLTINSVFILRKSVNYSVNLFSNRNMNSTNVEVLFLIAFRVSPVTPGASPLNVEQALLSYESRAKHMRREWY